MNFLNIGQVRDVYADGVHDDTAALQRCLDELRGGGTLYFPDGTYLISGTLIFYSHQRLYFSDKATLLRSDRSDPITRYLLAAHSDPDVGGWEGTHDVVISGGVFDGSAALTECLTIVNTVHCRDITIRGCRFIHGAHWHCIELNSTRNALVTDCVFDGPSYTVDREGLGSELIQLDASRDGVYGRVYRYDGTEVDFCRDATPCREITIENCLFKCDGAPGIGHHGEDEHTDITIRNNVFTGTSGKYGISRGFLYFCKPVHGVQVYGNVFDSQLAAGVPGTGIVTENPDKTSLTARGNVFAGNFTAYFVGGITEEENTFA